MSLVTWRARATTVSTSLTSLPCTLPDSLSARGASEARLVRKEATSSEVTLAVPPVRMGHPVVRVVEHRYQPTRRCRTVNMPGRCRLYDQHVSSLSTT
jgi:hypothetical protein